MWVSIQQVSKMYAKPERTLRHYAAQGKIIVRKKNRSWECNLASVEKLGWARTAYLGSAEKNPGENKETKVLNPDIGGTSETESNEVKEASDEIKVPRKFVLSNLGIYTELLALTIKIKSDMVENSEARVLFENAFKSIQSIGYGFYTFDKTSKVQYFSQARNYLINLLIQLEVNGLVTDRDQIKKQIEESILPGIGGLIRRAEKNNSEGRKYDKNSRSANFAKN
ncbi:MAG: hypothetical protein B7Y39_10935 [Bdellovibrio sp. 28-41-41]|nr:MAG: hypothetical protein B7Y39_10935 [Bdellovibrio sp. 28-41-41]